MLIGIVIGLVVAIYGLPMLAHLEKRTQGTSIDAGIVTKVLVAVGFIAALAFAGTVLVFIAGAFRAFQ